MKFLYSIYFIFFWLPLYGSIYPFETPTSTYLKEIELTETSSGLEGIDCIYVINLEKRPEKWERMKTLLAENGLKANRVCGVNGWELSDEMALELTGPYRRALKKGHIGCFLSHVSILKDAYQRGFNTIWVCEDDIEILEDVHKIPPLIKKLNKIDPNWDVFYTDIDSKNDLGERLPSTGSDFRPDRKYPPVKYYTQRKVLDREIMLIRQRFGMYSMIYSKKGIEKVLSYFLHVYLWTSIDIDIHYIPKIREYSTTRDIVSVWAQNGISDTQCPLNN